MALHQPFFDVIPVARELISKTKRIASKSVQQSANTITPRRPKPMKTSERPLPKSNDDDSDRPNILKNPFTDEPETMAPREPPKAPPPITRNNGGGGSTHNNSIDRDGVRVTSMFRRSATSHSRRISSGDSVSAFPVSFTQVLTRITLGVEHCIVDILSAQCRGQRQSHDPFSQNHHIKAKPPPPLRDT